MDLKPYDNYKYLSGGWLDKLPLNWEFKALKLLAVVNPTKSKKILSPNEDVLFLPMEALNTDGTYERRISSYGVVSSGYTSFEEEDVVLAKVTPCFENHKAAIVKNLPNGLGFGTTEIVAIRPNKSVATPEFIYYLISLPAFKSGGVGEFKGVGGLQRVPNQFISNFKFPVPPLETQQRIVDFLDRETLRIDNLVSEMGTLVDLLQEKRRVLISEVVTKGIPGAHTEFKDSGVEWLGEIPSSWRLAPIKNLSELINGHPFSSSQFNGEQLGFPLVRIRDIKSKIFETYTTENPPKNSLILNGDILIGMDGDFNTVRWSRGDNMAVLNQRVCAIRTEENLSKWINYSIQAPLKRINNLTYSTTVKHLSSLDVSRIKIALPMEERELLNTIGYLDVETAKIDTLIAEAQKAIELLKEERQAVIREVVTGKLEV